MAKKNYRGYLKSEQVRIKKYFYVLRPLLAVQWIENGLGIVPTEFETLLDTLLKDQTLLTIIRDLRERKSRAPELDYADAVPALNEYLASELQRLENSQFSKLGEQAAPGSLDHYFRGMLTEVWDTV